MAKSKSILEIQGTVRGMTFVDSRTYGEHVRVARGTHKKADVNPAFKESTNRLLDANVPAKIIKDAIDPYRTNFKGGQLWQRLLSQFRKQLRERGEVRFSQMVPVEIHERHPLSRLCAVNVEAQTDITSGTLEVTLTFAEHPKFKKATYINGYRMGVIVIFPDMQQKYADTADAYTPVIKLTAKPKPVVLYFTLPPTATEYVLCLAVEGFGNSDVNKGHSTQGMQIVLAGEVNV